METVSRGAVSAIFSPDKFVHPLLLLMPYGPDAPKHLQQLERAVLAALDPEVDAECRLVAALSLRRVIYLPGTKIPDQALLLIEVLRRVTLDLPRPVLLEQLAHAYLARDGLRLEANHSVEPVDCPLPCLLRDDLLQPAPTVIRDPSEFDDALGIWSEIVARLATTEANKLRSMGADDLCACLRMLVLYVMHKRGPRFGDTEVHRLEVFESVALSLWNLMRERVVELTGPDPNFEKRFGDGAQLALWHRLRADVLLKQKVQPPPGHEDDVSAQVLLLPGTHVVITGKIPPASSEDDRQTLKRYTQLQQPIPVARLPEVTDIERVVNTLTAEFPWAQRAIDELAADVRSRRLFGGIELGLTPTLLVGMPGCGKSRLVRRIAEELRVPFCPMALAGMNDSMALLGTARGWSTGQASPLIDVMLQHSCASALVLLDEIDKVGESSRNSMPPTVALLNLLEPENARRWYDTYLQTTCDVSKLMFFATANTLRPVSKPLLSRFRIVLVDEPRPCDFAAIVRGVLRDIATEWGLHEATLLEIAPEISVEGVRNAREVRAVVRAYLHNWSRERLGREKLH